MVSCFVHMGVSLVTDMPTCLLLTLEPPLHKPIKPLRITIPRAHLRLGYICYSESFWFLSTFLMTGFMALGVAFPESRNNNACVSAPPDHHSQQPLTTTVSTL